MRFVGRSDRVVERRDQERRPRGGFAPAAPEHRRAGHRQRHRQRLLHAAGGPEPDRRRRVAPAPEQLGAGLARPSRCSFFMYCVRLFTRLGLPFSQPGRSANAYLNVRIFSITASRSVPVSTSSRISLRKSWMTLGVSDRLRSRPMALTLPGRPLMSRRRPSRSKIMTA